MSRYFIYHENEFDDVVFDDERIHIEEYDEFNIKNEIEELEELEWLLEEPPDIYSDEHPWDTRVNNYRFKPEVWMLNCIPPLID